MNHARLDSSRADTARATIQDALHTLCRSVDHLLQEDQPRDGHVEKVELIESLLHTLPLATGEFGLARNRVRNARRYYQAREVGAARYELRLLACSLRHLFTDDLPREPRRRLRRPAKDR